MVWKTFLREAGVKDLQKRVETDNPESPDVKALFIMYSLESFIYKTLNFAGRKEDQSKVETMGPYAMALTEAISNAGTKRIDNIQGPFNGYRGLTMTQDAI